MHIVLISYEFPPVTATGGIGSYMYHLSALITKAGYKVTVFSANPDATNVSVLEQPFCTNWLVPAQNNETFRMVVADVFELFLKTNKVDLIESPEVGACALFIKERFPHIPLLVKMHTPGVLITKVSNSYLPLAKKIRFVAGALKKGKIDAGYWARDDKNRDTDLEYRICMLADTLLSPSTALKKWASQFWGLPPKRIIVLPNPFSMEEDLFELPLENRPDVISFVGKLSVLKGMKAFTKAIPAILQKNKGYKLFLVGRDESENGQSMKNYMQKKLGEYNKDIIYAGALNKEELKLIYGQSKVCVFPSLWENYPTVVLEAMAAGAAVSASNVGGIPELITQGVTGLLFNPLKPGQIASAVNKLLENDEMRLEMVKAARDKLFNKMGDGYFDNELLRIYTKYKSL